jgi:uncharacterized protein (DUF58 family)
MTVIPTEKGSRQLGKILETMAFFEGRGRMPINEVIESLSTQIARGSTVAFVTPAKPTNIQLCLEILLRRKLKPIVIQISRESFVADSETQNDFEFTNLPGVKIKYGDSISAALESIRYF